jgi:lipid-A-disaccharide synthase
MNDSLIFISAGDPSGDIAAGRLAAVLRGRFSGAAFSGLGGDRLSVLGQEQLASGRDLAVLGFWEVARRFRFFQKLMARCVKEIEQRRPKVIVLVDYPGFNLRLAARIKHLGIPIVYYIAPQVWAWGHKRVHEIKKFVDLLLVILPFEEQFFSDHGVPAKFIGHYLLEDIDPAYIGSPIPKNGKIALLPGSRSQEVQRMLVPMLDAASRYLKAHGGSAVVAAVRGAYDYEKVCAQYQSAGIEIGYDRSREILYDSDLAVVASGTATLEAGIIGRPMVIVYKTGTITYQIARRVIKLDKIGLVNLVLGDQVVPELIQSQASPESIAGELGRYQADHKHRDQVLRKLQQVPSKLGGPGASERAADEIGRYL